MTNVCPQSVLALIKAHFLQDLSGTWDNPAGGTATAIGVTEAAVNFAISQNYEPKAANVVGLAFADTLAGTDGAIVTGATSGPALIGVVTSTAVGIVLGAVATGIVTALAPLEAGVTIAAAGAVTAFMLANLAGLGTQAIAETARDLTVPYPKSTPTPTGSPDDSPTSPAGSGVGGAPNCPGVDRSRRKPPTPGKPNFNDPLVLDLAGAGIELSNADSSSAYFDYTSSGFRAQTGWIESGMGLLVTAPSDGQSVTAANLFGAQSGDGFADLAALDANHDGKIDASDGAYSTLRVWVDANQDGTSSAGELYTLADLGITSINVTPISASKAINGNTITASSTFEINGAIHTIAEVNLGTNRQNSIVPSVVNTEFTWDALKLPNLDGYGSMPDLRAAMSLDNNLANEVKQLVLSAGSMTGAQFDQAFQQMVMDWAGVSDVDPTSDGSYVDARHVALIYAYYGIDPKSDPYYLNQPNFHNGPTVWEPAYRNIIDSMKVRFASQIATSLANYGADANYIVQNPYVALSALGFDENTDRFAGDVRNIFPVIVAEAPANEAAASLYWGQLTPMIEALRIDQSDDPTTAAFNIVSLAAAGGIPNVVLEQIASDLNVQIIDKSAASGSIVLDGSASDRFVIVGEGDKNFTGSQQATFIYGSNSGNVKIANTGGTTLTFSGIASFGVNFQRDPNGADLRIVDAVNGKTITWVNYFVDPLVGTIDFADGTQLNQTDVLQGLMGEALAYLSGSVDGSAAQADGLQSFGYSVVADSSGSILGAELGSTVFEISGSGADQTVNTIGYDGRINILRFGDGVTSTGVIATQIDNGEDLLLTITSSGKTVTLLGQGAAGLSQIASVQFADGTIWTSKDLWSKSEDGATTSDAGVIRAAYSANDLTAGDGNVTLIGADGATTFTTGSGNDTIEARGGGNTFVLSADAQSLTIGTVAGYSTGTNTLRLPDGTLSTGVTVTQLNSQDIQLTLSSGQTVTLTNALGNDGHLGAYVSSNNPPVDQVLFADGSTWSWQDLIQRSIITMESLGYDTIYAGAGYGPNVLTAGLGDVTLDASSRVGNITLVAGQGSDDLIGSIYDTTYVVGSNAQNVTIEKHPWLDPHNGGGLDNILQFGDGISPGDISAYVSYDGSDITLTNNWTGQTVTLKDQVTGSQWQTVSKIEFSDGTVWTRGDIATLANASSDIQYGGPDDDTLTAGDDASTLYGEDGDDTLISGPGSSKLVGGEGSDHYVVNYGDGLVSISDGGILDANVNTLSLGDGFSISHLSLSQSTDGEDLILTDTVNGQVIVLQGELTALDGGTISSIQFADGAQLSREQLLELSITAAVGSGATTLYGDSSANTIVAGPAT